MKNKSNIFDNFIGGMDVSPEECLNAGYISAWYHPKEKDVLYISSKRNEDGLYNYTYDWGYYKRKDIISDFDTMDDKDGILDYCGMTEEEFKNSPTYNILHDISSYNGWFFNYCHAMNADTLEDILSGVLPQEGDKTFKDMTDAEKEPYLREVGLI